MRLFTKAGCLIAFSALQACSVSTPVRVAVQQQAPRPEAVSLQLGQEVSPALSTFTARFTQELEKGGVAVRSNAPFRLTLALSAVPAQSGLTSDAGKDAKSVAWQAAPRRKSLFENCKAERLRAVAVGSRGLDARPPLVAEAELDTCKDRRAELDRLATALAGVITRR